LRHAALDYDSHTAPHRRHSRTRPEHHPPWS
jgi:hypothetical protein